jgi:hypothetical protein
MGLDATAARRTVARALAAPGQSVAARWVFARRPGDSEHGVGSRPPVRDAVVTSRNHAQTVLNETRPRGRSMGWGTSQRATGVRG